MREIDKQYTGYVETSVLWNTENSWGIPQFEMPKKAAAAFNAIVEPRLRLGKLVERFVSFELSLHDDIEILAENIQIQQQKRTLGEIDCILKQKEQLIHLEIIYKFYLYNPDVGTTEFDHWIGPNKKDCLVDKLTKLKDKQLPLLYCPETQKYLDDLQLKAEDIVQQVYFKAQLFVPYNLTTDVFKELNPECISGFYISHKDLKQFKNCKFYMPEKVNWLSAIETQIPWLTYTDFSKILHPVISNKTAPLCWIKQTNGLTQKCFVVWW